MKSASQQESAGVSHAIAPWQILLPVGLGTALSLIGDSSIYVVLPTHTVEAGVTLASVGILLSVNRWVRLVANNVIGWSSDRWARRPLFILALFLGAVSTAIYALTLGFWPLFFGRLLWGISWAGIWIAGNGIVLDWAGVAAGVDGSVIIMPPFFIGAASGSLLGGSLTDLVGYHMAMGIAAALTFFGALFAWVVLPPDAARVRSVAISEKPELQSENSQPHYRPQFAELAATSALLGVNRLVITGIFISTFSILVLGIVGESFEFGNGALGIATLTGAGLAAMTLLSMAFTPATGGLSDRVGNRWLVIAGGLFIGVLGFAILASAASPSVFLAIIFLALASSSNQGLSTARMGDLVAAGWRGRSLGILYTVGDLGAAIGPLLAFAILPIWGTSALYWLSAALFALMSLVAIYWAVLQQRMVPLG